MSRAALQWNALQKCITKFEKEKKPHLLLWRTGENGHKVRERWQFCFLKSFFCVLCSRDLSTWTASLHIAAKSVAGASRLLLDGKSIAEQVCIETIINYEPLNGGIFQNTHVEKGSK